MPQTPFLFIPAKKLIFVQIPAPPGPSDRYRCHKMLAPVYKALTHGLSCHKMS